MQNQNQKPHQNKNQSNPHQAVLLEPVVELLRPQRGERYLDLTAGYGSHAAAIMSRIGSQSRAVLVDRDQQAVAYVRQAFGRRAEVIHSDFLTAAERLEETFDVVLLDLGVSSPQLDNSTRGFSFMSEGPLDMRMDQDQQLTAEKIINRYSERDLADLIYRYGEERQSRRIARAIVNERPLETTAELADVVARAYKGRSRIHPATRTFQAIRLVVNDELGQLERVLPRIEQLLAPDGRVAIISFHSLEDRIVKQYFRDCQTLSPINKNVVQGKYEDVSNPRARSAKLRAAIKNTNGHRPASGGIKNKKEVSYGH